MFCRASWDVLFHGSQCSSAFKLSTSLLFQPHKWFVTVSVYFVSINVCNCFSSSLVWRRNTFLRTTLCLPCGPWFWWDRHWRATRYVKNFDLSNTTLLGIYLQNMRHFELFFLHISLKFPVHRWPTWCKKHCLIFWNTDSREGKFPVTFIKTLSSCFLPHSSFLSPAL